MKPQRLTIRGSHNLGCRCAPRYAIDWKVIRCLRLRDCIYDQSRNCYDRRMWSAKQYVAFEAQRTRPVRDLLAGVTLQNGEVRAGIDIGCGPGNSTEVLMKRFPDAYISGIDSSDEMIAAARRRLPQIKFEVTKIEVFSTDAARFDVILANAALQWLPDHARLVPALLRKLTHGGALAVQMPDNYHEPAHVLIREIAGSGPWAERLKNVSGRAAIASAEWYYSLVRAAGGTADAWRTTYHHPLTGGAGAIVEWFKGSALRPYLELLDPSERTAFLAAYEAAIAGAYPVDPGGTVLLPFPRLFIVATRS